MSKLNIPLLGVQYDILIPYILLYTLYFYVFHPIGKLEKHPMGELIPQPLSPPYSLGELKVI